mmetsp:Transcript_6581/g.19796  ORF Transcript_6581/g.19796 Transcript_6581/m.19796 type:complete len:213 (-) Transcript_6581:258-896(-)
MRSAAATRGSDSRFFSPKRSSGSESGERATIATGATSGICVPSATIGILGVGAAAVAVAGNDGGEARPSSHERSTLSTSSGSHGGLVAIAPLHGAIGAKRRHGSGAECRSVRPPLVGVLETDDMRKQLSADATVVSVRFGPSSAWAVSVRRSYPMRASNSPPLLGSRASIVSTRRSSRVVSSCVSVATHRSLTSAELHWKRNMRSGVRIAKT